MSKSDILKHLFNIKQDTAALTLKVNTIDRAEYIRITDSLKEKLDSFEKEVKQTVE